MPNRDITIISGDSYTHVITFNEDQSDYTFGATITPNGPTIQVTQSGTTVTLFLTSAQTATMDETGATQYKWRFVRTSADATPDVTTLLFGRVIVTNV